VNGKGVVYNTVRVFPPGMYLQAFSYDLRDFECTSEYS
jgi:hypothetical protein